MKRWHLFFFDTETNGDPNERIVTQLAWRCDLFPPTRTPNIHADPLTTSTPRFKKCYVVSGATRLGQFAPKHLTLEDIQQGRPVDEVLQEFWSDIQRAKVASEDRVAVFSHNLSFDSDVIHKAVAQSESPQDWKTMFMLYGRCSMRGATKLCGLKKDNGSPKWPKNVEFFNHMFPRHWHLRVDSEQLHSADYDTDVTASSVIRALLNLPSPEARDQALLTGELGPGPPAAALISQPGPPEAEPHDSLILLQEEKWHLVKSKGKKKPTKRRSESKPVVPPVPVDSDPRFTDPSFVKFFASLHVDND